MNMLGCFPPSLGQLLPQPSLLGRGSRPTHTINKVGGGALGVQKLNSATELRILIHDTVLGRIPSSLIVGRTFTSESMARRLSVVFLPTPQRQNDADYFEIRLRLNHAAVTNPAWAPPSTCSTSPVVPLRLLNL